MWLQAMVWRTACNIVMAYYDRRVLTYGESAWPAIVAWLAW